MSPTEKTRLTRILLGIALAALALRALPAIVKTGTDWAMEPNGDSITYLALADGLERGCGFASWTGNHCGATPETNRTPGYAAFLSLMPGVRAALILQACLWSMLTFFVGRFTAELAGPAAGYCASGIIAADVPSIVSSNQVMSETLFTALLTAAVLAQLEILRRAGSPLNSIRYPPWHPRRWAWR